MHNSSNEIDFSLLNSVLRRNEMFYVCSNFYDKRSTSKNYVYWNIPINNENKISIVIIAARKWTSHLFHEIHIAKLGMCYNEENLGVPD